MNTLTKTLILSSSLVLIAGCALEATGYNDATVDDNVYTADFYDNSPWWGGTYYTGYTWNNPGVYWGRDYGYWQNGPVRWGLDGGWNRDGSWGGFDSW